MVIFKEDNPVPLLHRYTLADLYDWAGNDKLICDTKNKPVLWYHGGGFNHRWRNGIWFVNDPIVAKTYRESIIQKCYLKGNKTFITDFKGADWYGYLVKGGKTSLLSGANGKDKYSDIIVKQAFYSGYDSVIIRNISDAGPAPAKDYKKGTLADDCVVLSSSQIYWFM